MIQPLRYIADLCRETADNDDLFLCFGTIFLFYGVSLLSVPAAIIILGVLFIGLAFLASMPPKQRPMIDGES